MVKLVAGTLSGRMVASVIFLSLPLFIALCKNKPVDMPKRFVSIWFPYLTTDWHARLQPPLCEKAFVLKATVHNRVVVTAVNPLAHSQGIHKGMVLADAKALHPSLHVIDDKPTLATQLLHQIAKWCIRFTPVAA